MNLKIKVQTVGSNQTKGSYSIKKLPTPEILKEALDNYIETGKGAVVLHSSLYDYRYDTKLSDYHNVDSISVAGHIKKTTIEDEEVYAFIELNDDVDANKRYICFYRATMQSDPAMDDRTLRITNLFAVDLIRVLDTELTDNTQLSSFEVVEK
jgi:hypothetical protein